jgi:hypothetical protein
LRCSPVRLHSPQPSILESPTLPTSLTVGIPPISRGGLYKGWVQVVLIDGLTAAQSTATRSKVQMIREHQLRRHGPGHDQSCRPKNITSINQRQRPDQASVYKIAQALSEGALLVLGGSRRSAAKTRRGLYDVKRDWRKSPTFARHLPRQR